MHCQVLHVRATRSGFRVAHVQVGDLFGDVPAELGVTAGEPADLRPRYRVQRGRIEVAGLRAYPMEGAK